jgi:hypothetical protein
MTRDKGGLVKAFARAAAPSLLPIGAHCCFEAELNRQRGTRRAL